MGDLVVVDFEDALNERIRRELGPLRSAGVALTEDETGVRVDIPDGYVLTGDQAISLGTTLLQLGEIAKREEAERG